MPVAPESRYLAAARRIPRGETRTYTELAALAGRPGAARAAGRAVGLVPAGARLPWHRVVAADGGLARDPERARVQLRRLRREGARPREGEAVADWARRRGAALVGKLPERVVAPAGDARARRWRALQVEAFAAEVDALARGFRPLDGPAPEAPFPRTRGRRASAGPGLARRLGRVDWTAAADDLAGQGFTHLSGLLTAAECRACLAEAALSDRFERTIEMLPKGYGNGNYHYWRDPLPAPLQELRAALYGGLRAAAAARAGRVYPEALEAFWEECRAAGQRRASSILLCYGAGGVNHPHRDVYGEVWFPFQALVVLNRAGRDFEGGEFVLIEEPAGEPDRRRVIPVSEGDLVVFAAESRWEPSAGGRGRPRRIPLRHGMQPVRRGERFAAGVVIPLAR